MTVGPPQPSHPPPAPVPPSPTPGIGKGWIAIAAGTAVIAVIVAAVIVWQGRAEPDKGIAGANTGGADLPPPAKSRATDHAPAGCDIVLRIDVARVLTARPAVNHLVPVLDEIATGGGKGAPVTRRTTEFLRAAGIDPRRDVSEVIVCAASLEGPAEDQRLALVFGGSLRPEALVPAIAAADADAGSRLGSFDGRKVARTRSRRGETLIVGQAADGAIVVSNDSGFFESAVKTNKGADEVYRIPAEPEVFLVVVPEFFQRPPAGPEGPLTRHRADVRRLVMTASLLPTGGARGELRAQTRDATAAEALSADGARLLEGARDQAGGALEKALLGTAKLRSDGADVVLDAAWTEANVEQVVKTVADGLREAFEKGALAF